MLLNARKTALRVLITGAALGCLLAPSSALASGKPRLWWSVSAKVHRLRTINVHYRIVLPHGDYAIIQAKVRTGRWRAVKFIKASSSGVAHTHATVAGREFFRVAWYTDSGRYRGWFGGPRRGVPLSCIVVKAGHSGGRGTASPAPTTPTTPTVPAPAPTINWNPAPYATVGSTLAFSYSVTGLPSGGVIALQQQQGTADVWTTIDSTTTPSGSWGIANMGMGQNEMFRLVAVQAGTVLSTSTTDSVNVFGPVPFTELVEDSPDLQTFTGPQNTFDYIDYFGSGRFPGPSTKFSVNASDNDCISVTVDFVGGDSYSSDWPGEAGDVSTVEVVQQSANPASASAGLNAAGSVTAALVPGQSWSIAASQFSPKNNYVSVYINGTAICDSTASIIQNN
jgi:hypothetical protein